MDKIISHAGAAPTLEHVNVEMLPLTATLPVNSLSSGRPQGQDNRILLKPTSICREMEKDSRIMVTIPQPWEVMVRLWM